MRHLAFFMAGFLLIAAWALLAIGVPAQAEQRDAEAEAEADAEAEAEADAEAEAGPDGKPRYRLSVTLEPASHRLTARATITLDASLRNGYRVGDADSAAPRYAVPIWLQPALEVDALSARIGEQQADRAQVTAAEPGEADAASATGERTVELAFAEAVAPGESLVLSLEYAGIIHDPVDRSTSLTGDTGDTTSGIIDEQGVYLAGGGGWYPILLGRRLSWFDVEASVTAPMHVVTQGKLRGRDTHETDEGASNRSRWEAELPTPGLTLVAGPYEFASRTAATGVEVTTAFFADEAHLAPMFLDFSVRVLETYTDLLGDFPYSSFYVVANFFSTGYGMPGFTLLGDRMIAMGPMALMPGMLDHEIVHSWWGCAVYVDHARGNWCEAFTTYYTNYLAYEMRGEVEAQRRQRDFLLSYNVVTAGEQEVPPLRSFVWRETPVMGEVGYTKGAMFLHLLRATIGDEPFFGTMRTLAERFRGRFMLWEDVQEAFVAAAEDAPIAAMFEQWLDRSDIPEVTLTAAYDAERNRVEGHARQLTATPYTLPGLQVRASFQSAAGAQLGEPQVVPLALTEERAEFAVALPERPAEAARVVVALELANGGQLLRRLTAAERAPCVGTLVAQESYTVIVPAEGDAFDAVAAGLEREGARVLRADQVTQETLAEGAVLLLGTPESNAAFELLAEKSLAEGRLEVRDAALWLDGEALRGEQTDVLIAVDNPFATGTPLVAYVPYSPVGVDRTRLIFRYRWDSLVVFENGRPARREAFATESRCRLALPLPR